MTNKELLAQIEELKEALARAKDVDKSLLVKSEIYFTPLKSIAKSSKKADYNTYMVYFTKSMMNDKDLPLTDATCIIKYNRICKNDGQFVGDVKEQSGMMVYVIGQITFDDLKNYGFTMTEVEKSKMDELTSGYKPTPKAEKPKKATYKDYLA